MALNLAGKTPQTSYVIFFKDGLKGHIDVYQDSIYLNVGHGKTIGKNYITGLTKIGKQAMNRVAVDFEYYDSFGNKETDRFSMNENNFLGLKKILGK
ncbi:MAG: hypothetical protein V1811_01225 [Candidatus Micrarchaeota archaeon]